MHAFSQTYLSLSYLKTYLSPAEGSTFPVKSCSKF